MGCTPGGQHIYNQATFEYDQGSLNAKIGFNAQDHKTIKQQH